LEGRSSGPKSVPTELWTGSVEGKIWDWGGHVKRWSRGGKVSQVLETVVRQKALGERGKENEFLSCKGGWGETGSFGKNGEQKNTQRKKKWNTLGKVKPANSNSGEWPRQGESPTGPSKKRVTRKIGG